MQNLGFIIDEASADLGTVTGTRASGSRIHITVSVRPRGDSQLAVRASAYLDLHPIEDPEPYQDFFNALEKAVFRTAQQVDWGLYPPRQKFTGIGRNRWSTRNQVQSTPRRHSGLPVERRMSP